MSVTTVTRSVRRLGVLSTLADAGVALARGRPGSATLLLAAAAASTRVRGAGLAVSLLLRVYRRLR